MNENPTAFSISKNIDGHQVSYIDLVEICQGGPEVGALKIDGALIVGYQFGGPFVENGKYIYIPAFIRKFIRSGFVLTKIDLETKSVTVISKMKDLIYIDRIEKDELHYFEDVSRNNANVVSLP